MLFLPEISSDRPDDTQLADRGAALELFTTQGFHGTNIAILRRKPASLKAQSIPIIQARKRFSRSWSRPMRLHDRFSSTRRHAADRAFLARRTEVLAMAIRSMCMTTRSTGCAVH